MLASLFLCLDKVQSSMFREIGEEKIERKKINLEKQVHNSPIMTLFARHSKPFRINKVPQNIAHFFR